jgi:hypothetical protein
MSHLIDLGKVPFSYSEGDRSFLFSERDIPFRTEYDVFNPKTGATEKFKFSHSTGPEFDPNTKWIYWNLENNIRMEVSNDPEMTAIAAENYLQAKTRSSRT